MFEYDADRAGFSFGLFFLQVFLVPLVNLVFGLFSSAAAAILLPQNIAGYLVFSIQGLTMGYVLQREFPRLVRCGAGWVWAPPTALLVLGCIWDAHLGFWSEIAATFWPGSNGEQALGWLLIDLPAVACVFYSLGAAMAHKRTAGTPAPQSVVSKH